MGERLADERREFQRLQLAPALEGTFDGHPVSVVELGVLGGRLNHATPLAESKGELRFLFEQREIVMRAEVARRAELPEGRFDSGVRFIAALGDSGDHFREALARLVSRAVDERHEATLVRLRSIDGDTTVRAHDAQFRSYRFENGTWRRRPVFLPEQPVSGFTVARGEDADEMQRLCAVYEASDEEGRRLIRMFAELSVSVALQIPPSS